MSDKTPKYEAFVTPPGVAIFPWLTAPDTEHDSSGKYHTMLSIPFEEAQDIIAQLTKVRDDFIQTLPINKQKSLTPKPVYKDEYTRPEYPEGATKEEKKAIRDAWEGELTGNILLSVSMRAQFKTKDNEIVNQKPVVVYADTGAAVEGSVFGGSIIRLKGQIVPYTNAAAGAVGVSLRLKSVQVIEQVSGSGSGSFWTDFDSDE